MRKYLRSRYLRGKHLEGADLEDAVLHRTDLRGANLTGAELRGANMMNADLKEARLADVNMEPLEIKDRSGAGTGQFKRTDLSNAQLPKSINCRIIRLTKIQKVLPGAASKGEMEWMPKIPCKCA